MVWAWLAAYLAVLLAGAAAVALRSSPLVLRGEGMFRFQVLFLAGTAAALLTERSLTFALALLGALVLVVSGAARRRWIVFHAGPQPVREAVRRSLAMLRAPSDETAKGFTARLSGGTLKIGVRPCLRSSTLLAFRCAARSPKARLIERLLAKQFQGLWPRIRFRTR